jgi:hypothetical protein
MGLQVETYFERSCMFVDMALGILLGVFGIILCNVDVGELGFGIYTLELHSITCTCASKLWTYCLHFLSFG